MAVRPNRRRSAWRRTAERITGWPHRRSFVGEELGVPRPWRWHFDLMALQAFLVFVLIMPVGLWLMDLLVVRGYVLPLSYQWLAPWLGDLLLAVASSLMLWQLAYAGEGAIILPMRWRKPLYVTTGILWMVVGAYRLKLEGRPGPSTLYHDLFVYPYLGSAVTVLLVVTFFGVRLGVRKWRYWTASAVVLACIAAYWLTINYDGAHQKAPNGVHKTEYARPLHPWCGGIVTRLVCE